ncbi:aminopeptidase N [Gleimia sp. 6138-11-ORH1]|uniref:aminopeptidase N n=1 Tax=Gleimia sp. 6138-11-ORH1 TaxID=2973937 RepID=UPI00216775DE|nr:aminopeptidase N [Gleimia sp. 6138-11-ORH1]MCS4484342.1 aminopeptidase N [Gleimia sp. 6138-11-ORH1]
MQTITRVEALARANAITLDTISVALDLSKSEDKEQLTFPSFTTLKFSSQVSETFIDLVAAEVAGVKVNGKPADYSYNGSRVELKNLPINQPIEVEILASCSYSTTGEGLHRYFDAEDNKTYLYTHFEPTDARRVFACFDQPGMKARWQFTVTAPAEWVVVHNTKETTRELLENNQALISFLPTLPLSSYIVAVVAGPYAKFTDGTWQASAADTPAVEIELGLYCRQSLAPYFDVADVFKQTRAGFDFFHANYGLTYPWGKYDQVYVPEYNIGAMENPGCVTFNEQFISRGTPSEAHKQKRANVIFHEMCHMWFGDLVTPAWWDDLWLKESFADNQGSFGLAANTEYQGEWAAFAAGRKEWAYLQDQLPTTHPIAAEIPDVEAAIQNFDGITYAKGASVLKQLVAYLGEEIFFAGARKYFKRHAFGSASMQDLLNALTEAANEAGVNDRDLETWQQAWINTASPSRLKLQRLANNQGLRLTQSCTEATTGKKILRPHALQLGFYDGDGKLLAKTKVELTGESIDVDYPIAASQVAFVLPNDDDLTYAIIDLDDDALDYCQNNLSKLPTSLTRAVVWSALWAAVRACKLSAQDYLMTVAKHLRAETEFAVVKSIFDQVQQTIRFYLPAPLRDDFGVALIDDLITTALEIEDKALQQEWVNNLSKLVAYLGRCSQLQADFLMRVIGARDFSFDIGPTLKWQAIVSATAHSLITLEELDAYYRADPSGEASLATLKSKAAIPQRNSRLEAWDQIINGELTNTQLTAILEGLQISGTKPGVVGFAGEFFGSVLDYWQQHSFVMGTRFVTGAYPLAVDATNKENTDALLYIARNFLESFVDAPHALTRLMIENEYQLKLAVQIQRHWLALNDENNR